MPRPRKKNVVSLKLRVGTELVAELKAAAKKGKISYNAEAVRRLGNSLSEEKYFGGEAGRRLLYFITDAFLTAGENAGRGRNVTEWIKDPEAYSAAMFETCQALLLNQPEVTAEKCRTQLASLDGSIASHFANKASFIAASLTTGSPELGKPLLQEKTK